MLHLRFGTLDADQLYEIEYRDPACGVITAIRGKTPSRVPNETNFQWTAAVRALVQLVLGSIIAARRFHRPFRLVGTGQSAAASLDYAISKPTQWARDLFGGTSGTRAAIRRVFHVLNSEQKLPGPVELWLTSHLEPRSELQIAVRGSVVTSEDALVTLFRSAGGDQKLLSSSAREAPGARHPWHIDPLFRGSTEQRVAGALSEFQLTEPRGVREAVAVERSRLPKAFHATVTRVERALLRMIPGVNQRYQEAKLTKVPKLRIACLPFATASVLLLRAVSQTLKIELRSSFASTGALVQSKEFEAFDGAMISWGALVKLPVRTRRALLPVMLLPRTHFELMVLPNTSKGELRSVLLGGDAVGYPRQILKEFIRANAMRPTVKVIESSVAELMVAPSRDRSCGALVAEPFTTLLTLTLGCEPFAPHAAINRDGDNILVLRRDVKNSEHTAAVLRHALIEQWVTFLEQKLARRQAVDALFDDPAYRRYLLRLGALFRLEV